MKIGVIGAGAMGSVIGGLLAKGGNAVTLIDVWKQAVDSINSSGLKIEDKTGTVETIRLRATDQPASVGVMDLVLVFV
ncbi:MAG TPA: 2-dehydropantoate 2-reductase N-terminal domain-containing protein, partial [Candidatus Binatia bacterium]|nr:2-dehydropantoate 2-reductase N-terminal domain-containing protein [Candidatus Binatia bacterium]